MMNRIFLLALAALAFAIPPASDAVIVPLVRGVSSNNVKSEHNPHAVCNAIQELEHDICNINNNNNNNKSITMLCHALSELNSTLCAGESVEDIPVQKICPLLDFIDAELCPNGTAFKDIPVQKICPLLNFIDTELCPHGSSFDARQNKGWLKKIDGLFYNYMMYSSEPTTTQTQNNNAVHFDHRK